MKYLTINEIMLKLMPLSRHVREQVITENYIMFKHFIRLFSLGKRLKRTDIPAKVDIMKLFNDNVNIRTT